MGDFLNKGNEGFRTIRRGKYVDKSGIISFINQKLDTSDKLICVSRPRRFGKSFAAKMLSAYYDKSCDSRGLFEDLEIASDTSFEEHLNKYDVIYLDMTWFISVAADVKTVVADVQEKVIEELFQTYPDVKKKSTLSEVLSSVCKITGNKFVFIIDEWDALFREAKNDEEIQKEYIQLLRGIFKSSFTDETIAAAYITGILPIKKYGTQSAMTDFREYSMLTPKKLAEYVGFTESEVKSLCAEYDMSFENIKHWYDGYTLGKITSVYNPCSVMQAIENESIESYWTQSETYESLKFYIDMDFDGLKESIVQMLGGAHCPVQTIGFQNDMTSIKNKDEVLTLLVHMGYLAYDSDERAVHIPNEEMRQEFIYAVESGRHKL
jgi:hypothetical protein